METNEAGLVDLVLGGLLLLLAGASLLLPQLFRSVMAFISFGLVMAVVWVRLDVVDIALAEAMIGSGITGALFLSALGRMARTGKIVDHDGKPPSPTANDAQVNVGSRWRSRGKAILLRGIPAAAVTTIITFLVLSSVFPLPEQSRSIPDLVMRNLSDSGVSNPVTAVLLNYRAYDTLLEIGVVLLALLGLRAVKGSPGSDLQPTAAGVLSMFYRATLPFLVLFAAYMVWVGKYEPGGAFQAAALLAAGGIIGRMAGVHPLPFEHGSTGLRILVSAGFALFLTIGVLLWIQSGLFLQFNPASAGWAILVIEVAATVSIALSLLVLFLGSSRNSRRSGGAGQATPPATEVL